LTLGVLVYTVKVVATFKDFRVHCPVWMCCVQLIIHCILQGEKVFYFVRPTSSNIALYERWLSSSNQNETFFGDQAETCYRL